MQGREQSQKSLPKALLQLRELQISSEAGSLPTVCEIWAEPGAAVTAGHPHAAFGKRPEELSLQMPAAWVRQVATLGYTKHFCSGHLTSDPLNRSPPAVPAQGRRLSWTAMARLCWGAQ